MDLYTNFSSWVQYCGIEETAYQYTVLLKKFLRQSSKRGKRLFS